MDPKNLLLCDYYAFLLMSDQISWLTSDLPYVKTNDRFSVFPPSDLKTYWPPWWTDAYKLSGLFSSPGAAPLAATFVAS
jgi:hypothetical protein